jgi:hypothetical protein
MNIARKLILLALTACAFMAMTAGTASAVEVLEEASGIHCASVVTEEGGEDCLIHGDTAGGHMELGGPFGVMYTCEVALEGSVSESGHAIASWYDVFGCEGSTLNECITTGHRHPEARVISGSSPTWNIEADFCVYNPLLNADIECHLAGTITELANHDQRMNFVHTNKCEQNPSYSLQGELRIQPDAAHPAIELR